MQTYRRGQMGNVAGRAVGCVILLLAPLAFIVPVARIIFSGLCEVVVFRQTPGHVTSYLPADEMCEQEDDRQGRVNYEYTVNGKLCTATYPPRHSFSMPRAPYGLLKRAFRPGEEVHVFYDPAEPAQSTLEPRIEPGAFPFIAFVMPFWVVGWLLLLKPGWVPWGDQTWAYQSDSVTALLAYFVSSAVLSFSLFFIMEVVSWQVASLLGLLVPSIVVPGILALALRWIRRPTRAARSGRHVEETQPERDRRRSVVVLISVCAFWWFILGIFLVDLAGFWIEYTHGRATYRVALGTVLRSGVTEQRSSRGVNFKFHVEYAYEVDGRQYVSDRFHFSSKQWSVDEASAEAWRERYRQGVEVCVYYDPSKPERAVLELRVPGYRWFESIFMVPFEVLGVCMVVKLVRLLRQAPARSAPPGRELETHRGGGHGRARA